MPDIRLTPREEQVLRHVRAGRSNKDIADDLGVSEQAVKAHVSRLLLKFQVPNRTTLASEVGRPPRHEGMGVPQGSLLHEALRRSRELRDENRELMAQMRRELRDFRQVRRNMLGRHRPATPNPSPQDPQRAL